MAQQTFADANEINLGTFRQWLYKCRRSPVPHFVEVVPDEVTGRNTPEVVASVVVGRARVEFAEHPSPDYLIALVRGLDEGSS